MTAEREATEAVEVSLAARQRTAKRIPVPAKLEPYKTALFVDLQDALLQEGQESVGEEHEQDSALVLLEQYLPMFVIATLYEALVEANLPFCAFKEVLRGVLKQLDQRDWLELEPEYLEPLES
eukprot:TRINITY_DN87585_c0_g1_i1.p1 TRINITY_DN87585_c0_g1~~TRINITY_DN87585_c0_g1_i1.p1  ORF type:complete len:123 (-),score=19.06 TRINITY_DN87585_c0_g1_i1:30-398(-)